MSILSTARTWSRMVRLSHSVFALPFAFAGAALAARGHGIGWSQFTWIVVAMIAARNAAMGFNRLVDHEIDARNPRTAARELPIGALGRGAVWTFTVALSAVFVIAAFRLNPLCGWLSPAALAIVLGYSLTKRFTWASHLVLGLGLAIAPVGGWLAVRGSFDAIPWILALAVGCWVAGFDVVYACQDVEFDRREGLRSIPARFGTAPALFVARTLHVAAVVLLASVAPVAGLHPTYWLGVVSIAGLLAFEHRLVRSDDLSRVGVAFFRMNATVAIVYLATVLLAVWLESSAGGGA